MDKAKPNVVTSDTTGRSTKGKNQADKQKSKRLTISRSYTQVGSKTKTNGNASNAQLRSRRSSKNLKRNSRSSNKLKVEGSADENRSKENTDTDSKGIDGQNDGEFKDLIPFVICYEIVQELWDEIEDLCHERYIYTNANDIVAYELRDTWLSIFTQSYMDDDPIITNGPVLPVIDDPPPLPLNFDFWSHGALENLPHQKRESIMDPFLREPLSFLPAYRELEEEEDEEHDENEDVEEGALWIEERDSARDLVRPSTPVPTETSEQEDTWSTDSTRGSARDMSDVSSEMKLESWHSSLNTVNLDRFSSTSETLSKRSNLEAKKGSVEVVYRSAKFSNIEISGSTEIAYNVGGDKGKEKIAFRFPNKTSSESIKILMEEKKLKESRSDVAVGASKATEEEKVSDTQKKGSTVKPKKAKPRQKCK